MKKIISLLLALCVVFTLAACAGNKPAETQPAETQPAETQPAEPGIDYLALVNKLNALPEGWEDALETVTITNSVGDEVAIDLSGSGLYTDEELHSAMLTVKCAFASFGCELHSITYAGDEANNEENLAWLNSLDEGKGYTQVCELLSDFHTPPYEFDAWQPDTEYTAWQWWLARTEDGDWQLLTWGY